MSNAEQVKNITKWIKLFTYISATILLIANNNFDKFIYIIPILILIFITNYSRDYYLVSNEKSIQYIWISIGFEMLLIISIGFIDKNDINLLLFYICVSSTIIIHPFKYSIFLVIAYFSSMFSIYAMINGVGALTESIIPMLFNYGVSIAFVVA